MVTPVANVESGHVNDDMAVGSTLTDRVARRLAAEIASTSLRAGDKLPSERDLTARHSVSRVTMRASLRKLESAGLITAAPSRGWFVTRPTRMWDGRPEAGAGQPGVPTGRVPGFTEQAVERGLAVRSHVLRHVVRPANVPEADQLRMAPGGDLVDLLRLRYLDNVAIVVEHNRLPLAVCPALASTNFETRSLYETLRQASPPQVPMDAEYSVEARVPTAEEAQLLELANPIPVLVATTLSRNINGRPIELTVSAYRGDRYRYRAHIVAHESRA